jgi:hypothetical protein
MINFFKKKPVIIIVKPPKAIKDMTPEEVTMRVNFLCWKVKRLCNPQLRMEKLNEK